jgi:thiol:disulfide interchange protein DsbC
MVDLASKQNLTEKKVQSLSFVDWNKLPIKIAIIKIIGNGERKIAVFTDPDCPFCKRLDSDTIAKQKNLTVYYFLFPLAMHANAETDSKRIICAENPDKTYEDWMINDKKLPVQDKCQRVANLQQMKQVGSQLIGIEATPTIILPNGQIVSGLIPADYLEKLIADTSPVPTAAKVSTESSAAAKSSVAATNQIKASSSTQEGTAK